MSKPIDFRALAQRIAREKGYETILPVLEKELLHYEILAALDEARLLDDLVFQGGTSLRLCYGSERFSEDLDFAGGRGFDGARVSSIKGVLETAIARRYNVEVRVLDPKKRALEQGDGPQTSVQVDCWQIQVITSQGRPDIPRQKIKLEIAAIPAHTRSIRALVINHDELPYGYSNILIPVEEPEEIAADKLLALATSSYIRYRDIWDLRWLAVRPRFQKELLKGLVNKKVEDYSVLGGFQQLAAAFVPKLPDLINSKEFSGLMRRFLPSATFEQTLERDLFRDHLVETLEELYSVLT